MVIHLKEMVKMGGELSAEERVFLGLAFGNIVGTRRVGWRNISAIEQKEVSVARQKHISAIPECPQSNELIIYRRSSKLRGCENHYQLDSQQTQRYHKDVLITGHLARASSKN